jgi:ribosomal protein L7/L12
MKLNDLDSKNYAVKALKESFDYKFDTSGLEKNAAIKMLKKVQGLKKEIKSSPNFYENQTSPSYMKLVFMEEALSEHIVSNTPHRARIIIENEEVEKSQVILAAQDMVDSVQKMIEEVSDMLVKELPALTDSIQNEIGVNESTQFNQQAGESLNALGQALGQAKATLQNALNGITGQGGNPEAFAPSAGSEAPPEGEAPPEETLEMPPEEPEEMPVPKVGREKR